MLHGSRWAVSTIQKPRKAGTTSVPDSRIETDAFEVAKPSHPSGTVRVILTGKTGWVVYVPAGSGPARNAGVDGAELGTTVGLAVGGGMEEGLAPGPPTPGAGRSGSRATARRATAMTAAVPIAMRNGMFIW
jgi:hypothetical protein